MQSPRNYLHDPFLKNAGSYIDRILRTVNLGEEP